MNNGSKELIITELSFSDLLNLYLFLINDRERRGFGTVPPESREIINKKTKEIEEELYNRIYGKNPYSIKVNVLNTKNELKDSNFVVFKNEKIEIKDEKPETFVILKE